MEKLGVALIGLENWYHAFPLAEHMMNHKACRLVAVCHAHDERRREFCKRFGVPKDGKDMDEILRLPEVDIVIVTSATSHHGTVVTRALEAGKHVLCDKPAVTDVKEGLEVARIARSSSKLVGMLHNYRSNPGIVEVKRIVSQGVIGEPREVTYITRAPLPEDWPGSGDPGWYAEPHLAGGGGFIDHAAHTIDIVRWVLGLEPTHVYAHMRKVAWPALKVEDFGVAILEFGQQAVAAVESTWTALPGMFREELAFAGSEGTLVFSKWRKPCLSLNTRKGAYPYPIEVDVPLRPWTQDLTEVFDQFVLAVHEGSRPTSTWEDGLKTAAILEAAYRSASAGGRVEVVLPGGL